MDVVKRPDRESIRMGKEKITDIIIIITTTTTMEVKVAKVRPLRRPPMLRNNITTVAADRAIRPEVAVSAKRRHAQSSHVVRYNYIRC